MSAETLTNSIDENLEIFKSDLYLPEFAQSQDVKNFLESLSDLSFLKTQSSTELFENYVRLCSYSAFLLTKENRILAYINAYEHNIRSIVGKNLKESWGFTFEEKNHYIRANEPHCVELQNKKYQLQIQYDYLRGISQKIEKIADSIKNLGFEKNRINKL
jgi:hypothetical protein